MLIVVQICQKLQTLHPLANVMNNECDRVPQHALIFHFRKEKTLKMLIFKNCLKYGIHLRTLKKN